jgi:hypothetical protein
MEKFKCLLEKEAEDILHRDVNIDYIAGGIFKPFTLENIKIAYSEKRAHQSVFSAHSIKTNKRVWDFIFMRKSVPSKLTLIIEEANLYPFGKEISIIKHQNGIIVFDSNKENVSLDLSNKDYRLSGQIDSIYDNPIFDLNLAISSPLIEGRFIMKGNKNEPKITGAINLLGLATATLKDSPKIKDERIIFRNLIIQDKYETVGQIDFKDKWAKFTSRLEDEEKLGLSIDFSKLNKYTADININHIKINKKDIVSNISSEIYLNRDQDNFLSSIEGSLRTETLIIDYNPFDNVETSFTINGKIFKVRKMKIGDKIYAQGIFSFGSSSTIDMNMKIRDLKADKDSYLKVFPEDVAFSSTIDADIDIRGDLYKPDISADLTCSSGQLRDIPFESIRLKLEGTYPLLIIVNSRINTEEGYLPVEGLVDLRKVKTGNLMEDIVITSDRENIYIEGWNLSKIKESSEISLKKSIGENVSLLYKTYLEEQEENGVNQQELELEYEILENKNLELRLRENEEIFGLENKIKF